MFPRFLGKCDVVSELILSNYDILDISLDKSEALQVLCLSEIGSLEIPAKVLSIPHYFYGEVYLKLHYIVDP